MLQIRNTISTSWNINLSYRIIFLLAFISIGNIYSNITWHNVETVKETFPSLYSDYNCQTNAWCDQIKNKIGKNEFHIESLNRLKQPISSLFARNVIKNGNGIIYLINTNDYTKQKALELFRNTKEIIFDSPIKLTILGRGKLPKLINKLKRTSRNSFANCDSLYIFYCESGETPSFDKKMKRKLAEIGIRKTSITSISCALPKLRLVETLLHPNSLHYFNNSPHSHFTNFQSLIVKYKNWLTVNQYNSEHFAIDGSSVLSAYGIRDTAVDFDFICTHYTKFGKIWPLDHHNSAWLRLRLDPNNSIYNPNNFFFIDGLKIISLKCLREFKLKQGRHKDYVDVGTINKHFQNNLGSGKL